MSTTVIRQSQLDEQLRNRSFAKRFSASWSPSYVGAHLGIGRNAVYDLVKRGRLDAIRVVTDHTPRKLLAFVITQESVEAFKATRYQRESA